MIRVDGFSDQVTQVSTGLCHEPLSYVVYRSKFRLLHFAPNLLPLHYNLPPQYLHVDDPLFVEIVYIISGKHGPWSSRLYLGATELICLHKISMSCATNFDTKPATNQAKLSIPLPLFLHKIQTQHKEKYMDHGRQPRPRAFLRIWSVPPAACVPDLKGSLPTSWSTSCNDERGNTARRKAHHRR